MKIIKMQKRLFFDAKNFGLFFDGKRFSIVLDKGFLSIEKLQASFGAYDSVCFEI